MADPTIVEVTLRLSPAALEACALLVDAEVDSLVDLANDARQSHSAAFLRELRQVADHWRCLQEPLHAARKKLRSSITTSGTINTRPCPSAHDHNRLQARADEDGFPRVCEGCERRFERVDF